MKAFVLVAVGALGMAVNASALQTAILSCTYNGNVGGFSNSNPTGKNLNGTMGCPGGGLPVGALSIAGTIFLNNDFSTGSQLTNPNTTETYFTGMTLATIGSSLITASGFVNSTSYTGTNGVTQDPILGNAYWDDPLQTLTLAQA